jgi:uncharacterized protein (TIGR00251 family)
LIILETKDGVILEVYVKPKSKEFRIKTEGDEIVVFCREEPFDGKVNRELIKEFRRLFRKDVEIVSGFTSRKKKLMIRNAKKHEVERVLANA